MNPAEAVQAHSISRRARASPCTSAVSIGRRRESTNRFANWRTRYGSAVCRGAVSDAGERESVWLQTMTGGDAALQ